MSLCTFVLSKYLSGVGDELELDINQLSDESDYEIFDVKNFIADRIFDCIEDYIDFKYDLESIRKLLERVASINSSLWTIQGIQVYRRS